MSEREYRIDNLIKRARMKPWCKGCPAAKRCDFENCDYPERADEYNYFANLFF